MIPMTGTELFKELPLTFFRPLTGKFAPLYWSALETLYGLDFEGEPFEMTHEVAVEQVAIVIERNPDFNQVPEDFRNSFHDDMNDVEGAQSTEARAEADDGEREARRLARVLLKRLERSGWFDYEYRQERKGYVLNFRDYAARLLHTLSQVARQEQPIFEGLAHSIKAALSPQEIEEKPGVAIYNAQSATKDLVREIKILSRNIHRYAERALNEAKTPKELLELQLDIYQKKVVDSSYHRFKTTDNIFKYRSFILEQLDSLEREPMLMGAATQWVARSQAVEYGEADLRLSEWVGLIRSQLSNIHQLTDDLDRKNARYVATTVQKINYLLNEDRLLEGKLIRLLNSIAALPEKDCASVESPFPCFEIRTWDEHSLYTPPKERVALESEGVSVPKISEDAKRNMIERTRSALQAQFSRKNVYEIAEKLLKGREPLSVGKMPLESTRDLLELIFLSYHGRDRKAPFTLELPENWREEWVEGAGFRVHPGIFSWRGKEKE